MSRCITGSGRPPRMTSVDVLGHTLPIAVCIGCGMAPDHFDTRARDGRAVVPEHDAPAAETRVALAFVGQGAEEAVAS